MKTNIYRFSEFDESNGAKPDAKTAFISIENLIVSTFFL